METFGLNYEQRMWDKYIYWISGVCLHSKSTNKHRAPVEHWAEIWMPTRFQGWKRKIPSWCSSQLLLRSFAGFFFPLYLPRDLSSKFAYGYYPLKLEEKEEKSWFSVTNITKRKQVASIKRSGWGFFQSRWLQSLVFSLMKTAQSSAKNQVTYFGISVHPNRSWRQTQLSKKESRIFPCAMYFGFPPHPAVSILR